MSKPNTPKWKIVLGLIVLLLLAGLAFLLLWLFWKLISASSTEVIVVIISGSLTIIGSVIIFVLSRRDERQKTIEEEQRTKKIPVYSEFLNFWIERALLGAKNNNPVTQEETDRFLVDFSQKLMLWGSDEVVKKYVELRRRSGNTSREDSKNFLLHFEEIIYLIRSDLGHKNQGLEQGDLLRLFLTEDLSDVAKSLKQMETNQE